MTTDREKQETNQGPAAPGTAPGPWVGTLFEAEYQMLCDGIERERANVKRLADALIQITKAFGYALAVNVDVPGFNPAEHSLIRLAREALQVVGRRLP